MRTLEYVQSRINSMNIQDMILKKKLETKKEIMELPQLLKDDESLDYVINGTSNTHTWLIALTSQRLIFLDKGLFYSTRERSIHLDKISSVRNTKKLLSVVAFIVDESGKQYEITNMFKKDAEEFLKLLDRNIEGRKMKVLSGNPNRDMSEDDKNLLKLKELAEMNRDGIITDDEFEKIKSRLLSMI